MRLISYSPQFSPLASFRRAESLRDLLGAAVVTRNTSFGLNGGSWTPPLDIQENADQITVQLEAAGLQKDAFEITLHDDNLTISGERNNDTQTEETAVHSERLFGRFIRTVTLPSVVKTDAVAATYIDGVLTVVLPKAEEAKPRRIDVTVK